MKILFIGPNIFRGHGVDSIHERAIINTLRDTNVTVWVISLLCSKKIIPAFKNSIKDKDIFLPIFAPICLYPIAYAAGGLLLGLLVAVLKLANRKICDVVYIRNPLVAAGFLFFKNLIAVPIIVKTPTLDSVELKDFYDCNPMFISVAEKIEKTAFEKADSVFVSSPSLREHLMNRYCVSQEKIKLIPIGVDYHSFAPSVREHGCTVGYVGSYAPFQGIEYLIKAMAVVRQKMPSARLLLVGCRTRTLEELRDHLKLTNSISFLDNVAHAEVPKIMDKIDIFVISRPKLNVNQIATPLKLLEALVAAKAIVASDVEGINWIIKDGENGLLVKPEDVNELANAIIELLSDKKLRRKLSCAARETAFIYDWKTVVLKILEEINNTCIAAVH